jgi:hypothetical protein
MGSSLQQAQLAMRLISTPNASATHPAGPDRLEAIAKGWNSTTAQNNRDNNDVVINTPRIMGETHIQIKILRPIRLPAEVILKGEVEGILIRMMEELTRRLLMVETIRVREGHIRMATTVATILEIPIQEGRGEMVTPAVQTGEAQRPTKTLFTILVLQVQEGNNIL